MEVSKIEGQRLLRSLELKAYRSVVDALRAQGSLTRNKQKVLKNIAETLNVDEERYRSEIRRAVNDEILKSIVKSINVDSSENTWHTESMRNIPSAPMLAPETAYTALADNISDIVAKYSAVGEQRSTLTNQLKLSKSRINKNIIRFHSNRIFDPLVSNRTFRDQEILKELEKVKQSNTFLHPNDYLDKITDGAEISDVQSQTSTSKMPFPKIQSCMCEPRVVLKPAEVHESGSMETNRIQLHYEDTFKNNMKTISNVKSAEKPEFSDRPMIRKAKLNAKRWNPKTQTLETPSPEKVAMIENAAKLRANARDRNVVKSIRSNEKSSVNERSRKASPEYFSRFDGNVSSTQRGRRIVRRYWGRRPNRRTLERLEQLPESTSRIRSEENAKMNNCELIEVSDLVNELADEECSNDQSSSSEFKISNNYDESDYEKSDMNSAIEISYDDELSTKTTATSQNIEINQNSLVSTIQGGDMRPHTFNLIPVTRRLKMMKKRAASPVSDAELRIKKFQSSNEPPLPSGLISLNEEEVVDYELETETNTNRPAKIEKDKGASGSSSLSSNKNANPVPNNRRIRVLPPGSKEMASKMFMLGNVRVRSIHKKPFPPITTDKLLDEESSIDSSLLNDSSDDSNISSDSSRMLEVISESPGETLAVPSENESQHTESILEVVSENPAITTVIGRNEQDVDPIDSIVNDVVNDFASEEDSENSIRYFATASHNKELQSDEFHNEDSSAETLNNTSFSNSNRLNLFDIESADVVIGDINVMNASDDDEKRVVESEIYEKCSRERNDNANSEDEVEGNSITINTVEDDWKDVNPESVKLLDNLFEEESSKNEVILISINKDDVTSIEEDSFRNENATSEPLIKIVNARELLQESLGTTKSSEVCDEVLPVRMKRPQELLVNVSNPVALKNAVKTISVKIKNNESSRTAADGNTSISSLTEITDSDTPLIPTQNGYSGNSGKKPEFRIVKSSTSNVLVKSDIRTLNDLNATKTSSTRKTILPPVPKKVYDLYESPDKKLDKNVKKISNIVYPSQTLKTSVPHRRDIIKTETLIEISSLNEDNSTELPSDKNNRNT